MSDLRPFKDSSSCPKCDSSDLQKHHILFPLEGLKVTCNTCDHKYGTYAKDNCPQEILKREKAEADRIEREKLSKLKAEILKAKANKVLGKA